jgi:geranylgeranyl diphosphate synthase type I
MGQGILEAYREEIEHGLARALQGDAPLRSLLRYHIGLEDEHGMPTRATGKFLRPSLVLFVAEQLGASLEAALPSALGLEMIHSFSLIHDDIQDRDLLRRGRPAVWTICGIEQAINAGDLMHALAIAVALDSPPPAAGCLIQATQEMIEGQCRDLEFERREVTAADYLAMIDRKTGALLRSAFELGGIAAGVNGRVRTELTGLGRAVGRAFQIQDDLLGIWGEDDVLGKPTGSDIRRRKKTLPVVLLFEQAKVEDGATLDRLYDGKRSPETEIGERDIAWVVGRLNDLDVRSACEALVQRHLDEAIDRLRELPFSVDARSQMEELIGFLARRER